MFNLLIYRLKAPVPFVFMATQAPASIVKIKLHWQYDFALPEFEAPQLHNRIRSQSPFGQSAGKEN